jgi:hypothetical protein
VSVVKINAITVPGEDVDEFVRRYRTPAGEMPDAAGFEGFELLQPDDDRSVFFERTSTVFRFSALVRPASRPPTRASRYPFNR